MNLKKLVWRELFERKSQMITIFVGILLGITTVIAIKNITYYSEKAVAREMDSLGGQCARAAKVRDATGLLLGRHAQRDDSRGIRAAADDVESGRRR